MRWIIIASICIGYAFYLSTTKDTQKQKDTTIATPATTKTNTIKNSDGIEYIITGDNSTEVARHKELLPAAKTYLKEVQTNALKIQSLDRPPEGRERTLQSIEMTNLLKEGEIFGTQTESNSTGLHECRSFGIKAKTYWDVVSGSITTITTTEAIENYNNAISACEKQIKQEIEATVTLTGPVAPAIPPFKGCLEIISFDENPTSRTWTCSASVIKS